MKVGLISIIIPAYNMEKYLENCVKSVLNQTYSDIEIIIIDDGSIDNTCKIEESLSNADKRVKIIRQRNKGVSMARNAGIEEAKGEYIAFVDADDEIEPEYIETLVLGISKSELATICYSSQKDDFNNSNISRDYNVSSKYMLSKIYSEREVDGYVWNKLFKSNIIHANNIRFPEDITIWEDMYFVIRYLMCISNVNINTKILYYYRYRDGSAVNSDKFENYRSKYYIMKLIKDLHYIEIDEFRRTTDFRYYQTMFSYINKCFRDVRDCENASKILADVSAVDLVKRESLELVMKYIYLKIRKLIWQISRGYFYGAKK